jgi:hypothetical protein
VRLYSRSRATAYFLLWKVAYCCSCVCCRNLVNSSAAQPGGVVLVRATDDGAEDGSEAVSDIVVDSEVPDPLRSPPRRRYLAGASRRRRRESQTGVAPMPG